MKTPYEKQQDAYKKLHRELDKLIEGYFEELKEFEERLKKYREKENEKRKP